MTGRDVIFPKTPVWKTEQLNRFTRLQYRNWVNLSALLDRTDVEVVFVVFTDQVFQIDTKVDSFYV